MSALRTAAFAFAAAALLGGCADRVAGIRPAGAVAAQPVAAAVSQPACRFHVDAIEDLRDREDLGALGHSRVGGERFDAWFRDGIAATPGHSTKPAPVHVRIAVARAYIQSLSTLKSANLVVKVRVTDPQGRETQKLYRGVDATTNWWNSEGEVQDAFDAALADLRRQLASDLAAACGGMH